MTRFFYNITFHIIIVMVLGNMFLGIVVDTFADLRDKENAIENDKKNVCFICQLTRDDSINKNIDFEKHTKTSHKVWNYVYFLTYLKLNNPNDFNALEFYVWKKVNEKDISWIPIVESQEE
jgi:hypothetical protein